MRGGGWNGRPQYLRSAIRDGDPPTYRSIYVGLRLVRVGGNLRGLVSGNDRTLSLTQGYLRLLTPRALNWREITEPGM